jgi:hypothetical protein
MLGKKQKRTTTDCSQAMHEDNTKQPQDLYDATLLMTASTKAHPNKKGINESEQSSLVPNW